MDFTVDIKVDSRQTEAALARVRTELDRAERAGKAAGEVVSRALASGRLHADQAATATRAYTRELINAERAAERAAAAAEKLKQSSGGFLDGFTKLQSTIGGAVGVFGVGLGAQELISSFQSIVAFQRELEDGYVRISNRLQAATNTQAGFNAALRGAVQVAGDTGAALEPTVALYSRLTIATRALGVSQESALGYVATINRMLSQGGASAQEQSSAILQLSQAFGSGRLAGEEFNAVNEAAPNIIKAFADQLGVAAGELKKLASEGKVTSEVMIAALENMGAKAEFEAARARKTLAQQMAPLAAELQANPDKATTMAMDMPFARGQGGGMASKAIGLAEDWNEWIGLVDGEAVPAMEKFNAEIGNTLSLVQKLHTAMGGKAAAKGGDGAISATADFATQMAALLEKTDPTARAVGALEQQLKDLETAKKRAAGDADRLVGAIGNIADAASTAGSNLISMGRGLAAALLPKFFDTWAGGIGKVNTGLSETQKLLNQINAPWITYERTVASLDILYQRGAISAAQYNAELIKIASTLNRIEAAAPRMAVGAGKIGSVGVRRGYEDSPTINFSNGPGSVGGFGAIGGDQNSATAGMDLRRGFAGGSEAIERQLEAQRRGVELTKEWNRQLAQSQKEWDQVRTYAETALGAVEGELNAIYEGSEASFSRMIEKMMADLHKLIIRQLFAAMLTQLLGGGAAAPFGGIGAGLAGGLTPTQAAGGSGGFGGFGGGGFSPSQLLGAPRLANGGSFMVGGPPGIDRTPVFFWGSRGERVTVETNQQQHRGGGNGDSRRPVNVYLSLDKNEAEIEDMVLRIIQRNPSAIAGVVTGR